jgi:hypothetical protein
VVDVFVALSEKAQRDLRSIAEQRLADEISAFIRDLDDRSTRSRGIHNVAAVNPQMARTHAIRPALIHLNRLHHAETIMKNP